MTFPVREIRKRDGSAAFKVGGFTQYPTREEAEAYAAVVNVKGGLAPARHEAEDAAAMFRPERSSHIHAHADGGPRVFIRNVLGRARRYELVDNETGEVVATDLGQVAALRRAGSINAPARSAKAVA